jgi:transposase
MPSRDEILSVYQAGPDAMVAWVEQLLATHAGQLAQLLEAQTESGQQVQALAARVAELEARLKRDSHNSHQPPSSDGLAKLPRRRSRRKRSGKTPGGQPGHAGTTLAQVAQPDTVVTHTAPACAQCGVSLDSAPIVARERRQVFELPPVRPQVIEHQVLHQACPRCQAVSAGQFPPEVAQPVQYGPGVKALVVYLQEYQHLPFKRTQDYFRDVHQLSLSEGTMAGTRDTCAQRLEPVAQAIHGAVSQAAVTHFDPHLTVGQV